MTMFWKSLIRNSAGCTKFNFCRVSSYRYVCIRPFINRDKYILTFVLYIKISWVQRTHCLCQGKFWFLVVSNFDQRQNNEVNTCIRGVPSFSKESQSEICAWIVRNEFKSSGNNRPFAASDHVVQNRPCWRASSLLFPLWDIKTKRPEPVRLDLPLFWCPSAGIIMSLPSSMADFVPRDR